MSGDALHRAARWMLVWAIVGWFLIGAFLGFLAGVLLMAIAP